MSATLCKFCREEATTSLGVGTRRVEVCARHDRMARETGKELVNTAARMAGAALEKKAPTLFEAGKAVFTALRIAQAKNEGTEGL